MAEQESGKFSPGIGNTLKRIKEQASQTSSQPDSQTSGQENEVEPISSPPTTDAPPAPLNQGNQTSGLPENQIPFQPDNQITRNPNSQIPSQPDEIKRVNLCVKVPEHWRKHWAIQARIQDTTMTEVMIEALTARFGLPDDQTTR